MDGEPEPDLVVPVLPRHSRVAERQVLAVYLDEGEVGSLVGSDDASREFTVVVQCTVSSSAPSTTWLLVTM